MKLRLLFALLLLTAAAFADQVTLANGDRLTGVITKFDDKKIYMKTDYSDEIIIKWSAVSKVAADKPLHIERADGAPVEATTLAPNGTDVTIESAAAPVTVPEKDIKSIRSNAQEIAYEESLHPGWRRKWEGGGNFGVALARGNS